MRILFIFIFAISIANAQKLARRDFYVSASGTGSGIGTQSDPLTMAQLINNPGIYFGTSYTPYDTHFYFNRGDTFDGQFTISKPCSVSAYGTGAKPVIRGSVDISDGWTLEGSNIYYRTLAVEPKSIFISGTEQKPAQTNFIPITAKPAANQVTGDATVLNALNATESLVGATIITKESPYRPSYSSTVSAYSAGTITVSTPNDWLKYYGFNIGIQSLFPSVNDPFKLFGKKSFITDVGEWYYDAVADRLYIKTAGGAPTNIRYSDSDYGILVNANIPEVSITNISFREEFLGGVYSQSNNNISVTDCDFTDIHLNGVSLVGNSRNITVSGCTFQRIKSNAIHVGGVQGGIITRNTIDNIGTQSDWLIAPYYDFFRSMGNGIHLRWDNLADRVSRDLDITYNVITNVGYSGMTVCGQDHIIQYNKIDGFMQKWNDGGGIYLVHRVFGQTAVTKNITIDHNIVLNGTGGVEGYSTPPALHAEGIYVDNNCTLITVSNNTVANVSDYAYLVNFHTTNCTVTGNKAIGADNCSFSSRDDVSLDNGKYYGFKTIHQIATGHVFTGNISAVRSNTARSIEAYSYTTDVNFNPFTTINNNHYVNLYGTDVGRHNATSYTLANWKTKIAAEASSTNYGNTKTFTNAATALTEVMVQINDTEAAIQFNIPTGYLDVYGNAPSNPYTIQPYESLIYLKQ